MQFERQLSPVAKLLKKIMLIHEYTSNLQGKGLGFCLVGMYFCDYIFSYTFKSFLAIVIFLGWFFFFWWVGWGRFVLFWLFLCL